MTELNEFSKCKHELNLETKKASIGNFCCKNCGYLWLCDINNLLDKPVCMFILDPTNRVVADFMPSSFHRNHDWGNEWK